MDLLRGMRLRKLSLRLSLERYPLKTGLLARALVCKIVLFWLRWPGVMVDCD